MQVELGDDTLLERMSRFVAAELGLSFPPDRRADLWRDLEAAAFEEGFENPSEYAEWLMSTPLTRSELQGLINHLTVGETYFFREEKTLRALAAHVLAPLIERRRSHGRHLRLWSAACSTGEEAYTLAMLVQQLLPDWRDWRIEILATDINERSLEKAQAGVYGEWSFRVLAPELRNRFFEPVGNARFAVKPEVRQLVRFEHANLAADTDSNPDVPAGTMDLVLCRNLLIYFTPEHSRKLADRLHVALADDGWLAVSPSECSQSLFAKFAVVNIDDAILYSKAPRNAADAVAHQEPPVLPAQYVLEERRQSTASRTAAVVRSRKAVTSEAVAPPTTPVRTIDYASEARALADAGRLGDALVCCEGWIAAAKVDPAAHYLKATILQEVGDTSGARQSLQRCVYLQPEFVLAHFALGNLAHREERPAEAERHLRNARSLLAPMSPDAPLPEAEGLTAGRLLAIVGAILR